MKYAYTSPTGKSSSYSYSSSKPVKTLMPSLQRHLSPVQAAPLAQQQWGKCQIPQGCCGAQHLLADEQLVWETQKAKDPNVSPSQAEVGLQRIQAGLYHIKLQSLSGDGVNANQSVNQGACVSVLIFFFVCSKGKIGRGFLHVCSRPLLLRGRINEVLNWIKWSHTLRKPGYSWWESR